MTELYVIKIQKWYRKLPSCRKCSSKMLKYICLYCYHDKHQEDCIACKEGLTHNYKK